ncbi:hypothetical protein [Rhodococcus sp. NPDC049939]|uniref:hypothetical protein n=1 Tax=Rhodococcus sp. NPDC049939 TaxID=3155511 RepID=UPI0033EA603C
MKNLLRREEALDRADILDLPTLELQPTWGFLDPPEKGDNCARVTLGPNGEWISLWTAPDIEMNVKETRGSRARFARTRLPEAIPARISIQTPESSRVVELDELTLDFCLPQPMPNGNILVVGARCLYHEDGPEHNAVLYSPDGRVIHTTTFGDGISFVCTTEPGTTWVGYHSQGTNATNGWGGRNGPGALGHSGLVRFGHGLDLVEEYEPPNPGTDSILEVRAMTVAGSAVWASSRPYYGLLQLVRIQDGVAATWQNDAAMARGLVVSGDRIGLIGGWGPGKHDRLVYGRLEADRFVREGACRIALPGGSEVPLASDLLGVGGTIHVITEDDQFYQVEFDELLNR